jgi:hypothetical protein
MDAELEKQNTPHTHHTRTTTATPEMATLEVPMVCQKLATAHTHCTPAHRMSLQVSQNRAPAGTNFTTPHTHRDVCNYRDELHQ